MKINRTFSIDIDLAQKLRNKPNQSRIVCKAVRRYLANQEQFTILDFKTLRLLSELRIRDDCPESIKILIQAHLTSS